MTRLRFPLVFVSLFVFVPVLAPLRSAHARAVVGWSAVAGGAIENFGRDEAKFYPAASAQARPAEFGLYPRDRIPTAGAAAALVRCIELREARIGGAVWYRFRLESAYGPSKLEYDWCRQRKSVDDCDSTVPIVCEGPYLYLPRRPDGTRAIGTDHRR